MGAFMLSTSPALTPDRGDSATHSPFFGVDGMEEGDALGSNFLFRVVKSIFCDVDCVLSLVC